MNQVRKCYQLYEPQSTEVIMAAQPPTQPTPGVYQQQAPQKSGCGPVAVFAISTLAFIIGLLGGVGILAFLLSANPDLADSLGIELATKEVVVEKVVEKTVETGNGGGNDYALVYPVEESLRIEGPIAKKEVVGVITDKRYNLRTCYVKGKEKNPSLKGEMFLQFTIAKGSGKVQSAIDRESTFDDAGVKNCILDEVKKWRFSEKQSAITTVKVDLLLLPIQGTP